MSSVATPFDLRTEAFSGGSCSNWPFQRSRLLSRSPALWPKWNTTRLASFPGAAPGRTHSALRMGLVGCTDFQSRGTRAESSPILALTVAGAEAVAGLVAGRVSGCCSWPSGANRSEGRRAEAVQAGFMLREYGAEASGGKRRIP